MTGLQFPTYPDQVIDTPIQFSSKVRQIGSLILGVWGKTCQSFGLMVQAHTFVDAWGTPEFSGSEYMSTVETTVYRISDFSNQVIDTIVRFLSKVRQIGSVILGVLGKRCRSVRTFADAWGTHKSSGSEYMIIGEIKLTFRRIDSQATRSNLMAQGISR